jgi:hypothetical protein
LQTDKDGSGSFTAGDVPIANRNITLNRKASGGRLAALGFEDIFTMTDGYGNYAFIPSDIGPGFVLVIFDTLTGDPYFFYLVPVNGEIPAGGFTDPATPARTRTVSLSPWCS